jgi:hypothetical protein
MRETRMGKRVFVHGVSSNVACCRLYCCATVDTPLLTLSGTGSTTHDPIAFLVCWITSPSADPRWVSGRNHLVLQCHLALSGSAASVSGILQRSLIIFATP